MTKITNSIVTTIMIVQKTSEITPKTSLSVALTAKPSAEKTVCSAYSGLVPMSPKTTPRAPSASAVMPTLRRCFGCTAAVCSLAISGKD